MPPAAEGHVTNERVHEDTRLLLLVLVMLDLNLALLLIRPLKRSGLSSLGGGRTHITAIVDHFLLVVFVVIRINFLVDGPSVLIGVGRVGGISVGVRVARGADVVVGGYQVERLAADDDMREVVVGGVRGRGTTGKLKPGPGSGGGGGAEPLAEQLKAVA